MPATNLYCDGSGRATALPEPRKIAHISGGRKKIASSQPRMAQRSIGPPPRVFPLDQMTPIGIRQRRTIRVLRQSPPGSDRLQSNVLSSCVAASRGHAIFIFARRLDTLSRIVLLTSHHRAVAREISSKYFLLLFFCSLLVGGPSADRKYSRCFWADTFGVAWVCEFRETKRRRSLP